MSDQAAKTVSDGSAVGFTSDREVHPELAGLIEACSLAIAAKRQPDHWHSHAVPAAALQTVLRVLGGRDDFVVSSTAHLTDHDLATISVRFNGKRVGVDGDK